MYWTSSTNLCFGLVLYCFVERNKDGYTYQIIYYSNMKYDQAKSINTLQYNIKQKHGLVEEVQYNNKHKLNINSSTSLHLLNVGGHIHNMSLSKVKLVSKHLLHDNMVLILQLLRGLFTHC